MKLISLEDEYSRMSDDLPLSPLYPAGKSGCSSCGKKGININITNTANGNTASGNSESKSNSSNSFSNSQRSSTPQVERNYDVPEKTIVRAEPERRIEPRTADKTETILNKILAKLNEPRPVPSTIQTEKVPDRVKIVVKEREVRIPTDRKIPYVKPIELTTERERKVPYVKPIEVVTERERQIPYVKDTEINVPRERIKTQVIEREVPRFFDRIKEKVLVIRANQPPAPASFT